MKQRMILIMMLCCLVFPVTALCGQVKVKHLGSIYTDSEGLALKQPIGVTFVGDRLWVVDGGGKRLVSYKFNDEAVKPDKSVELPGTYPLMVEPAQDGGLYVLDGRARDILVVGSNGEVSGKFTPKGLPSGTRMVPRSIRSGSDGSLLVLDVFSRRVLIFSRGGDLKREVPVPEQVGTAADVAMDRQGNLYLLDSVHALIYKAQSNTDKFEALTGSLKESMNFPVSLVCDDRGNLYLLDKYGSGLDVITADGTYAGRKLSMGWHDSFLNYPSQVSVSDSGDLFIADMGNHRAQHFRVD